MFLPTAAMVSIHTQPKTSHKAYIPMLNKYGQESTMNAPLARLNKKRWFLVYT